jgi:lysophospholipase L1-like esterase
MNKLVLIFLCVVSISFRYHQQISIQQTDIQNVETLEPFYAQLRAIPTDSNTVSIVHIGDSHIQSDFLTGMVRNKMQTTFGNAGRGFVFPYRIAHTGGALDVKFDHSGEWSYCTVKNNYSTCNLGVSGFSAISGMGSDFRFRVRTWDSVDRSFTKLKILDKSGDFLPKECTGNYIHDKENEHTTIYFDIAQDSIELAPFNEGSSLAEIQGLVLENEQLGVLYHAMGVNGSTVSQYLRSTGFEEQINELNASLVIISFGTNDCYTRSSRYCSNCVKENYRTLIKRIRAQNPDVSILIATPPDHYVYRKYPSKYLGALVNDLLILAAEENVAIWNLYEAMGGKNSIVKWRDNGLAGRDLIHFTISGYELQGEMLYEALMRGYSLN